MKIVFYNEILISGGIEKCLETLAERLYKKYDIEIVYIDDTNLDNNIVKLLSQYAYVHKLDFQTIIHADICIWCRLYMDYNLLKKHIKANNNFLWIHSQPLVLDNYVLNNQNFLNDLDEIICVSQTIQKQLNVAKNSTVIHNFLPSQINQLANLSIPENIFNKQNTLKLVTVSRLSRGKGFERILNLVKSLKENNVEFEYIIIGKGRTLEKYIKDLFKNFNEIKFLGFKENPYPYIKKADYLVQLSDYESWGNVITEAKHLSTPVIITNFETAYEQIIDDYNGILIDLNETNYSKYLNRILNKKQLYKNNLSNFKYENEIDKWLKIIEKYM